MSAAGATDGAAGGTVDGTADGVNVLSAFNTSSWIRVSSGEFDATGGGGSGLLLVKFLDVAFAAVDSMWLVS